MKTLPLMLAFFIAFSFLSVTGLAWYEETYTHRIPIYIDNPDSQNHNLEPFDIWINSSNIDNCNEIRFIDSLDNVELNSRFEINELSENGVVSNCSVTILCDTPASTNNNLCGYAYYGSNSNESTAELSIFWDDFSDPTTKDLKWNEKNTSDGDLYAKIENGYLNQTVGLVSCWDGMQWSSKKVFNNSIVETYTKQVKVFASTYTGIAIPRTYSALINRSVIEGATMLDGERVVTAVFSGDSPDRFAITYFNASTNGTWYSPYIDHTFYQYNEVFNTTHWDLELVNLNTSTILESELLTLTETYNGNYNVSLINGICTSGKVFNLWDWITYSNEDVNIYDIAGSSEVGEERGYGEDFGSGFPIIPIIIIVLAVGVFIASIKNVTDNLSFEDIIHNILGIFIAVVLTIGAIVIILGLI